MAGHPGYLLPDGECYTEELACCLVFYPDKPEYRRALLGSLVYLSTWLAWERDEEKRGKDAARAWKDAVDETLECWTMSCLEELIADVATIRLLMETKKDCCDSSTTYYPTDFPETEIEPFIGDPPEFYGETAVTDWEDWAEHVCYNAHKYVDYLKDTAGELQDAVQLSSIFVGLIGATLALLAFSGIGLPIAFALTAGIVAGLVLGATTLTFQDTADDFEAARQSIICAIIQGYNLPDVIEAALSSGTDWDLFYQFVDYSSALAIIYEGGYNDEYLPSEVDDSCGCEVFSHFVFEWPTDLDGFNGVQIITEWDAGEYIKMTAANHDEWKTDVYYTWAEIATRFSLSLPIDFDQLRFKFYNHPGTGSPHRNLFHWKIMSSTGFAESGTFDTDDYADEEWHSIIINWPTVYTSNGGNCIYLWMFTYGHVDDNQRVLFDNLGLYLR